MILNNEEFSDLRDYDSASTFQDIECSQCTFVGCVICAHHPLDRTTVRNVKLTNCKAYGCTLFGAIVEEVIVDRIATYRGFHTWATVFKHVTLRGRIGSFIFNPLHDPRTPDTVTNQAFLEANAAYYAKVDWALDISEAQFTSPNIRGIPARLIRRDPATQVVVTREKALEGHWKQLDLSKTYWPALLRRFQAKKEPDVVLIAQKGTKWRYRDLLDGLQILRDAGVAEPD